MNTVVTGTVTPQAMSPAFPHVRDYPFTAPGVSKLEWATLQVYHGLLVTGQLEELDVEEGVAAAIERAQLLLMRIEGEEARVRLALAREEREAAEQ